MNETSQRIETSAPVAHAYLLWTLTIGWAGVLFWSSARPGSQIPGGFAEIGHLGECFVFGCLLYAASRASGLRDMAPAIGIIVASLYGITDEFHQHFVVMRTPDIVDWGVDTVGATFGVIASSVVSALARRRGDPKPPSAR